MTLLKRRLRLWLGIDESDKQIRQLKDVIARLEQISKDHHEQHAEDLKLLQARFDELERSYTEAVEREKKLKADETEAAALPGFQRFSQRKKAYESAHRKKS